MLVGMEGVQGAELSLKHSEPTAQVFVDNLTRACGALASADHVLRSLRQLSGHALFLQLSVASPSPSPSASASGESFFASAISSLDRFVAEAVHALVDLVFSSAERALEPYRKRKTTSTPVQQSRKEGTDMKTYQRQEQEKEERRRGRRQEGSTAAGCSGWRAAVRRRSPSQPPATSAESPCESVLQTNLQACTSTRIGNKQHDVT